MDVGFTARWLGIHPTAFRYSTPRTMLPTASVNTSFAVYAMSSQHRA
jgi:hypothetical protein